MWSSQEGSLLLWLFLLGTWSSVILFITRHGCACSRRTRRRCCSASGRSSPGCCLRRVAVRARAAAASEGVGLNPLLRDPGMMIHPPMLYSGYTLFAIPFAFGWRR